MADKMPSLDAALDELAHDLERAESERTASDTQYHRRMYVRALFAWLEGFGHVTRQYLIELDNTCAARGLPVDWGRHALLHEDELVIDENGKTAKRRRRFPFKDHFAFTLKAYATLVGYDAQLFSDHGWTQLRNALLVRDRVTHPKGQTDIQVTDEDLACCKAGYSWFASTIVIRMKDEFNRK